MSRAIGQAAEEAAAAYLLRQGFEILARNYTVRGAEVDIVAREGDCLAFVEVKYRGAGPLAAPRESVTRRKRQRVGMAALHWLQARGTPEEAVRFDVVEVTPRGIVLLRAAYAYEEM